MTTYDAPLIAFFTFYRKGKDTRKTFLTIWMLPVARRAPKRDEFSKVFANKTTLTDKELCVVIVSDSLSIEMIHNLLLQSFGPHVETQISRT